MEDDTLVESSFSVIINASIEKVDIPSWCFTLPESEYQSCSPAHCSAGATTAPAGRRMSINVEILGGSLMVQHYIEEIGQPDHLRLVPPQTYLRLRAAQRWGIFVTDGSSGQGTALLPSVSPTIDWVRLPQRFPVRIQVDSSAPTDLRIGQTASVAISHEPQSAALHNRLTSIRSGQLSSSIGSLK
jgi:hypothetical protein